MSRRVGIDTGGTFTDLLVFDEETGEIVIAKRPSTPDDPARAIFDAFDAAGVLAADVADIALGTTIATNALIERKGARVLFLTTEGFRDLPFIQRVDKADPYDLQWEKPRPFVERADCLEVSERVGDDGRVIAPLGEAEIARVAAALEQRLAGAGPDEIVLAISLLFAYANAGHEARLAEALTTRFPQLRLSVGHRIAPTWREYERANTAIVDAYLKPAVARLVERFVDGLSQRGFAGSLSIVKSNGGQVTASATVDRAVETVLSGLAGGIVAGRMIGQLAGEQNVVTLDMGGTSADVGIVRDGEIDYVAELELEFGLPLSVPAIELVTVGAGGGSIAWIDSGGLLRVGPQSAGAVPGPVCYGLGGEDVTVTDANLVLGRLDPAFFLGGAMQLDRVRAAAKVAQLAAELHLSPEETAHAVIELACERMASSIREAVIARGADPRDFHLVAFGGAGPLHASYVAEALGMPGVIVPPHPGLASALGTLVADRRVDRRSTLAVRSDAADLATVDARLGEMTADALAALAAEGFDGTPVLLRSASLRYAGQNYETEVPLPAGPFDGLALERTRSGFHERHETAFGYAFPDEVVELVHLNVTALGSGPQPGTPELRPGPAPDPVSTRTVWFATGSEPTPIYLRDQLPAGFTVEGPAVVEESDSTTLVLPGERLEVTRAGLLRISRTAASTVARARRADTVTMSIVNDQLVAIAQEMGVHMMRTSYSPIFSESRDFSCALFNARGELIAQGAYCPAHLGAITETVRCLLEEVPAETLQPGDVVLPNDPFRGGCHLPEHMLLRPVYAEGRLVALAAVIGHLAEIGAVTIGSFASDATEVFQEGLRLPPVHLVRAGEHVDDVWKIILSNHRTPRHTWGDLHAMIGALHVADERLGELFRKYGTALVLDVSDELIAYAERLTRTVIATIPAGEYRFDDGMEDDGSDDRRPYRITVRVAVEDGRMLVDYTGSDPQARGPINATFGVTTSATYNALFQLAGTALPRNAGAHRCTKTVAPPGSVVNVRFPGPSVGGNTETQPKLVGMILGALAPAVPDRVMAAEGVTSCNFLFGGIHPRTGEYYAHYHFEASGWGGRATRDGNSAQNHIHGNCRNTPVEVFETRFPFLVERYELIPDSGGPGRFRGGLATRRVLRALAPLTLSVFMDRVLEGAWGLFGGESGRCASIAIERRGRSGFRTFQEEFGTASPSKFAGIAIEAGDRIRIESAGGGGYGSPAEREPQLVWRDVAAGFVTPDAACNRYLVATTSTGLDTDGTAALRGHGGSRL